MALPEGIDREKLLEVALALLCLNIHGDKYETRVWKGMNFDVLDAMLERGWISNPRTPAKSVALSEEGEHLAREYFRKHFGVEE